MTPPSRITIGGLSMIARLSKSCNAGNSPTSCASSARTIEPAPQHATAQRGGAAGDAGEQGIVAAAGEIRLEFEVAACGGIEQQGLVAALDVELPNVRV